MNEILKFCNRMRTPLMNAAFYHQIARDYEAGIERLDPEIFERLMRKIR